MSVASTSAASRGAPRDRAPVSPPDDPRAALLQTQLKKVRYRADALIEVLHAVQDIYGYLSKDVLTTIADALELPPSRVLGVATFYHLFSFEPRGEHTCTVCTGTACFVKGADALISAVSDGFGVGKDETRADGVLSLLQARCVGSCGLAPVALVDGGIVAKATPEMVVAALRAAGVGAPAAEAADAGGEGAADAASQDAASDGDVAGAGTGGADAAEEHAADALEGGES
jgi:bidirectional [NiFe] hydrogenase diaphorase subunit